MPEPSRGNDEQMTRWSDRQGHRHWLMMRGQELLAHYRKARVEGGFAALDDDGNLAGQTAKTIITARMVHCYSIASLMGVPGAAPLADHGLDALLEGPLRDPQNGGWFQQDGKGGRKNAYVHAFVVLASATAVIARRPRAIELCEAATSITEEHFWLADEGVMAPSFAADWTDPEPYRGANANMHTTEGFLAMADATGDDVWLTRAVGLVRRFVHDIARLNNYTLPEHFDPDWRVLPDYNRDKPADDLRPWGMTPGHFAEWAGLLLKVECALAAREQPTPEWLLNDAIGLFDSAMEHGWNVDGAPGMIYTIGNDLEAIVTNRPWWVQAEAANTAYMLHCRTGQTRFESAYRMLWDYIADTLIDRSKGGWWPEVDRKGNRSRRVYPLRDDLYHAYQATVTPLFPISASIAHGIK
ncbi:AGE family epimerase/isomerase [Hyphomonas oceanitis]|uniref:AGE family epimerase/isomerase n=1 Tax=Hyphomonas oceanitis TaxID=81033 RepID=UPI0030016E61